MWQTVDNKYSYFDLKDIDWDSVYTHYSPMVQPGMTDQELFYLLDSMLYDLRDGHVNLVSPFDLSRNWKWYLNYPDNFDYETVERYYLGNTYRIAGGMEYTIIDSVGYIYYGSFTRGFSEQNLNAIMSFMKGTKALIVDVRNNGGGSLNNAFVFSQRLIQQQKQALLSLEKTGPGPEDFGNALSHSFGPSEHVNYDGPVALLINRRCYSATNTFAAILSQYENVVLIGDQTGGGGGVPVDYELPIGWSYRFSATRSLIYVKGELYDIELGIPPDIAVSTDSLSTETDEIIETALDLFR